MPARSGVVRVIPVDHTSGPLDGSRGAGRGPGRPKTKLDPGRGLGEFANAIYDCVRLLESAYSLAVDLPDQGIRRPHETVIVIVVICVGQTLRVDTTLGRRCPLLAFPEPVTLPFGRICSGKLPIDLVANIAHSDEGCHHAIPSPGFHSCRDGSIVDVSSRGKTDTVVGFGKEQIEFSI